jgi:SAM-dependent methyltransferase
MAGEQSVTTLDVFERLAEGGRFGQAEEQGGNYYADDPVERRNLEAFIVQTATQHIFTTPTRPQLRFLVSGCGDGLETEILADRGFDVTAYDYSPNMVAATRRRLNEAGLTARLVVTDAVAPDLGNCRQFTGVMFAQVAQFLTDDQIPTAIANAAALARRVLYIATTQYDDPTHRRRWVLDGEDCGETIYHGRPADTYIGLMTDNGFVVVHRDHFDAGPGDYKNDYLIGVRR